VVFVVVLHFSTLANEVLYQTNFESPAFTPGLPIRGQDNWEMFHDGEAISVSTNNAHTGTQCLRFEGALLEQYGPNAATAYCFSRALEAFSNSPPPIVEITASIRLDGPQTGTNGTPEQDILSANLMAVVLKPDGTGESLGGFFVSSAGKIFTCSSVPEDNYKYSVPYTFGTYRTLTLRVDFIARRLTWSVDGVELGSGPFLSTITAERLASGYLFLNGPVDPINTPELTYDMANYTAYFDDYRIESVPLSPVNAIIEFGAMSWPYTNFLCDEFESAARVRVTRRGFIDAAVRVTVTTTNGTAIAGQDYEATSTFVTFAAGETNKEAEIPLLADDYWAEPDRTFQARITDLPPGATSPRPAATIIIRDNERPGSIDHAWSSDLGLPPLGANEIKYAWPNFVLRQPDGKLIVDIWVYDSDLLYPLYWRLIRINPDGSVDPTYPIRDSFPSTPNGFLLDRQIAVLPDGKLLVWDSEDSGVGFLGYRLRYLLNPDGSQDHTFPSLSSSSGGSFVLIPQPDGKVLVSDPSVSPLLNGQPMPWLFRLNNNGTLDTTFNAPTNISESVGLLPNGQLWVAKYGVPGNLRRLNNDGSLDASFAAPANLVLYFLHSLPNGQWLVISPQSTSRKLYRLNQNGSLDPGFVVGTAVGFNAFSTVSALGPVLPQADGKLIVAGIFRTYNGQVRNSIVRLNPDGSVDSSYQTGQGFVGTGLSSTDPGQTELRQLPDGRLFVNGNFETFDGKKVTPPIILNSNGTRDPDFDGTLVDIGGVSPIYGWFGGDTLYFANGYGLGRVQMDLPLRIVSNLRDTNSAARLVANALAGRSYTLQTSESLANWTDLATQFATTNRIELTDVPTNSPVMRLYRVRQN